MRKTLLSDRGNTLVLVLGLAMVIAILAVPLATMLGTSHRQAVMNAQYEKAHEQAESVALVFQKLLLADQDDLQEAQHIRDWAAKLQAMNLCQDSTVVYDEAKRDVTVSCTEGSGSVAKTVPVKFQLNYNPASSGGGAGGGGGGVGTVSDGTEFYQQYAVVARNMVGNDKSFCTKQETGPPVKLDASEISHVYDTSKYAEEFNKLVDYYVGANFEAKMQWADGPGPVTPTSPPSNAPTGAYTYNASVNGYPNASGGMARNGNIQIDVTSNSTVRINGDLISSGSINVYFGSGGKLIVTGSMQAQSIRFYNSSSSLISVGQWSTDDWETGTIVGGDSSSMVASGTISFEQSASVRVAGSLSGNVVQSSSNQTIKLKTGGHLLSGGNMTFGLVNGWTIGGDISVGNVLRFDNTLNNMTVKGSIYAKNGLQFQNTVTGLTVEGSILAKAAVNFANTSTGLSVGGDVKTTSTLNFKALNNLAIGGSLLATGNVGFSENANNLTIGGYFITASSIGFASNVTPNILTVARSMVAAGNITFPNTSNNLTFGESFLSGGSISFQSLYRLNVNGLMGASQNISFNNNVTGVNELGGIYASGDISFPNWYQYNGNGDCSLLVGHNPPPAGGTGSSGPKLVFGSWRS